MIYEDRHAQIEKVYTLEFLGWQVEAKLERKDAYKAKEYRLGARVHADVQVYENNKREIKIKHQDKIYQHLDSLVKQIEEENLFPKKASHVANIGSL